MDENGEDLIRIKNAVSKVIFGRDGFHFVWELNGRKFGTVNQLFEDEFLEIFGRFCVHDVCQSSKVFNSAVSNWILIEDFQAFSSPYLGIISRFFKTFIGLL